jgi:hypothetical protein
MSTQPTCSANDDTSTNAMRDLRDRRKSLISVGTSFALAWILAIFMIVNGVALVYSPSARSVTNFVRLLGVAGVPIFIALAITASRKLLCTLCDYLEALVKAK